jgi:hypothetical protein
MRAAKAVREPASARERSLQVIASHHSWGQQIW